MDCRPTVPRAVGRPRFGPPIEDALAGYSLCEARCLCFDGAMNGTRPVIQIEHAEDPRIADYRNLKDAQLARDRDRFIVEGRGNLRVLLERSPFKPESILLSERAYHALEAELPKTADAPPIYRAEQAVLDGIVGFPIHRGVLAVCPRGEAADPNALAASLVEREPAPRIVVLEGLINHDNVGGIFRNAMGLGARGVFLCDRTADPLYRKAIRTSMGGSLVVPFARNARGAGIADLLGGLRRQGFNVCALDPDPAGVDLAELEPAGLGPVALLVGTEGEGLSEQALQASDYRVRIEMETGVDSLNVSVAAAIALHRFR